MEEFGYSSLYYEPVDRYGIGQQNGIQLQDTQPAERRQVHSKEGRCSCYVSDKCKAYKNITVLSLSLILTFGSFLGILSLQSSVNANGGLGLIGNASLYATFILIGFLAPGYVQLVGTKYGLLSGYVGFLIYTLSNYYPSLETLVPGSVIVGIMFGPMWVSLYSHSTTAAIYYSPDLKKQQNTIVLFSGIMAMATQVSGIVGNLVSSIVLVTIGEGTTTTDNGIGSSGSGGNYTGHDDNLTHNSDSHGDIKKDKLYLILISVYLALDIISIVMVLIALDRYTNTTCTISTSAKITSPWLWFRQRILQPLVNLLAIVFKWKMMLLLPMFWVNGLLLGFTVGIFSQEFVSDSFGIKNVGFIQATFGFGAAVDQKRFFLKPLKKESTV